MQECNMVYRAWHANQAAPKGFVSKTLSKVLNERRKEVPSIKRRLIAEVDDVGRKKRRRNKHLISFDPQKHVVRNKSVISQW